MAVDTQDKRASVLGFGLAALLILPAPGAIDQPDRQQLAYSYRGLTAAPSEVADGDIVTENGEDFTITLQAEDRIIALDAEDRTIVVPERPTL